MMPNNDLQEELKKYIEGDLRFDYLSRYLYSTDASSYQVMPAGVVIPRHAGDVEAIVKTAGKFSVPITARGSGTSLSGQAVGNGLVVDFSRYIDHILEIDPGEKWARVEAGVVLDHLNAAVAPHQLMVGADPSSASVATFGGSIANNAAGNHSILFGMMIDHVMEVDVMLSDGTRTVFGPKSQDEVARLAKLPTLEGALYREIPTLVDRYSEDIKTNYPKIFRNVAGYNLNWLLEDKLAGKPFNLTRLVVGSEGTFCSLLSAKINLVPRPSRTRLMILHFQTMRAALELAPLILSHKPAAIEMINRFVMNLTRSHADYGKRQGHFVHGDPEAVLIVEFFGQTASELESQAVSLQQHLERDGYHGEIVHCVEQPAIDEVWFVRKASLGLLQSQRSESKPVSFMDDAAVPVEELVGYVNDVEAAFREEGSNASFTAHVSAGCLHVAPTLNLKTVEGLEKMHRLSEAIANIAIAHHGTTTGEHGEGIARGYFNERLFGPRLHQAFKEVKALFDPENLMNPGKMISTTEPWDPKVLRYYPGYQNSCEPKATCFDFSGDGGFAGLVEMCNGDGNCRRMNTGLMCPSFRITRDEMHSTRGRANALRAALSGYLGDNGLLDEEIYKILDLCLMCKACKKECPSGVDMTKLKSEFLAYYYSRKGVPLRARLFGNIGTLIKMGSMVPGLTNYAYSTGIFKKALEFIGIDSRRTLPAAAQETFQAWFKKHPGPKNTPNGQVIFWDDCFTSYNTPEIGKAAVKLLEAAGFEVLIVAGTRCCGRPLFSKGLLNDAKRNASHNIAVLAPYVNRGIPIVGVEPSCITCFRDEYLDVGEGEAARLIANNTFHMEEFLMRLSDQARLNLNFTAPEGGTHILLHGQCYQKSTIGTELVLRMLRMLPGTTVDEIPSGCCGMAGSFGYEKEHYELSMQIGEEVLFPAVRSAEPTDIIAAAGTSCRSQISTGTGRKALHPVIIVADRLKEQR